MFTEVNTFIKKKNTLNYAHVGLLRFSSLKMKGVRKVDVLRRNDLV